MGSGTELKITHTYRNSQELIDIAGGFVQKNSSQIRKQLISPKHLPEPVVIKGFDDSYKPFVNLAEKLSETIEEIIAAYGEKSSILLIGRFNYDMYKLCYTSLFTQLAGNKVLCAKYPKANISFLTAHSSKGLGYDNVVIVNMFEGKFGFPCQIEDDPIMKLVTHEDKSMPYAEERRLFYVALTRTKNRVYIMAPKNRPSRFLVELIKDYKIRCPEEMNLMSVDLFSIRCPICNFPLKYEFNKNYGLPLYICTNEVEVCDFMTNDNIYRKDIYKCDKCADGYMIVKRNSKDRNKAFYGCTNYDNKEINCKNTVPFNDPLPFV